MGDFTWISTSLKEAFQQDVLDWKVSQLKISRKIETLTREMLIVPRICLQNLLDLNPFLKLLMTLLTTRINGWMSTFQQWRRCFEMGMILSSMLRTTSQMLSVLSPGMEKSTNAIKYHKIHCRNIFKLSEFRWVFATFGN